jgi:hypothetical protein
MIQSIQMSVTLEEKGSGKEINSEDWLSTWINSRISEHIHPKKKRPTLTCVPSSAVLPNGHISTMLVVVITCHVCNPPRNTQIPTPFQDIFQKET